MNGYYIQISNNLLLDDHCSKMGQSVWLFMWFLDKLTSIDEDGVGKVLGGKPITFEEVRDALKISDRTYGRWLKQLVDGGYIITTRTPHGYTVKVLKAKKSFGKKVAKSSKNTEKRYDKNVASVEKRYDTSVGSDTTKMSGRYDTSVGCNIRQYNDNTVDNTILATSVAEPVNEFIGLFVNINPSFEVLFKNKTQRAAAERLLKKFGIDAMRKTILVIEKTNAMQYAPIITTPLELEKKGGQLKAFLSKENQTKLKNQIVSV